MPVLDSGPYVWSNWLGEEDALTTYFRPSSVAQILAFLAALPNFSKLHIRAAGSGLSSSDVARPWRIPGKDQKRAGIVVHMEGVELDWENEAPAWWRNDFPPVFAGEALYRAPAGMLVKQLHTELGELTPPKALANFGSYDGMTLIGAISTCTHGSGMATSAMQDFVASIEMIAILRDAATHQPVVKHVRVEPWDGPTDKVAFEAARARGEHTMELIADDDAFYSAVVGLGFFGIITAVTIRVRPPFWLRETQRVVSWPALEAQLPALADQPFFDFSFVPRKSKHGGGGWLHRCLTTERQEMPWQGPGQPRDDRRTEQLRRKSTMLKKDRPALTAYLAELASANPRFATEQTLDVFDEEAKRTQTSASNHIFKRSIGRYVLATSAEVAVPSDQVVLAVETLIEHLAAQEKKGRNHISPVGVRFSQGSKHYLSMQYGRKTCTLEAPILIGTREDGRPQTKHISAQIVSEMLEAFETRMKNVVALDARMHLGQRNWTTRADLERYPKFQAWWSQYKRFNAFGIFSNAASARWELDDF